MTIKRLANILTVSGWLLIGLGLTAAEARAQCTVTSDACPTYGSEWRLCQTWAGTNCLSYRAMTGADNIKLERATIGVGVALGACVNVAGAWSFYPLANASTNVLVGSSMSTDAFICLGAGNDIAVVQTAGYTCPGATGAGAWNYGSNRILTMYGQEGADQLTGGAGQDFVCGGTGNDYLFGGSGADTMDGWTGNDLVGDLYSTSADQLWGYDGADSLQDDGGTGDLLYGENETDCVCDAGNAFASLSCYDGYSGDNATNDYTCNYQPGTCNAPTGSGCEYRNTTDCTTGVGHDSVSGACF